MKSELRNLIIAIAAFTTALTASAVSPLFPQLKVTPPDINAVRRAVTDRTSPYYYPRLMEEFQRNDSTMKLDKYRHLYLGYLFQEDYDPYRAPYPIPAHVIKLYGKENPTRAECDSIIRYCRLSLSDNPLDMIQMQQLIAALRAKGSNNMAEIWEYKLRYLLMAILSTGTGKDEENAWYIVETQHEYVLLNQMGLRVSNHLFYEPRYEFITVDDHNGRAAGGYYFNIGPLLDEYYRKHPEDRNE